MAGQSWCSRNSTSWPQLFLTDWRRWPVMHMRIARVNEDTYSPNTSIKMGGDHPVVRTNEHFKARNIYIFMGHHPELFQNASFTTLVTNSIFWAAQQ